MYSRLPKECLSGLKKISIVALDAGSCSTQAFGYSSTIRAGCYETASQGGTVDQNSPRRMRSGIRRFESIRAFEGRDYQDKEVLEHGGYRR